MAPVKVYGLANRCIAALPPYRNYILSEESIIISDKIYLNRISSTYPIYGILDAAEGIEPTQKGVASLCLCHSATPRRNWLRCKDSNLERGSQSPVCCRYTTPQKYILCAVCTILTYKLHTEYIGNGGWIRTNTGKGQSLVCCQLHHTAAKNSVKFLTSKT